jgi:riboflavin synthase
MSGEVATAAFLGYNARKFPVVRVQAELFTGLIQSIGTLSSRKGDRVTIRAELACELNSGESVAIDGICLTVVSCSTRAFGVDISPTTRGLTTAGNWRPGARLNLARALALGDRLGGHVVTGHVDGTGRLLRREPLGNCDKLWFEIPETLARVCIPLGAIAVDGVSLTLNEVEDSRFAVTVIPETLRRTTLGDLEPGCEVNLETDVLAKYVERLLAPHIARTPAGGRVTWAQLAQAGYTASP